MLFLPSDLTKPKHTSGPKPEFFIGGGGMYTSRTGSKLIGHASAEDIRLLRRSGHVPSENFDI